jgi:putative tricarboxylic transport membrane protein
MADRYSAPGLLPAVLGIVITGMSVILLVRSLLRSKGKVGISGGSLKNFFTDTGTKRIFITIALCLGYAVLLGKVFFPVLTFLFVFVFVVCFEYDRKTAAKAQIKKILIAALLALCVSAAVTLVFERLFLVRLP